MSRKSASSALKEIRTPNLLIRSHSGLSAVLASVFAGRRRAKVAQLDGVEKSWSGMGSRRRRRVAQTAIVSSVLVGAYIDGFNLYYGAPWALR